ncbi:MAG: lipopolysaccharide heptosyltransferase II [Bryobacteraceae bacterium]
MKTSSARYRRILVRATNWVGDAVMCLPALQSLRASFPNSHIALLARPWVADLYRREPFSNEVILYEAPKGWHGLWGKRAVVAELRDREFDCAVLLQNAFEAAALAWCARIPVRIGYNRDGRGPLLTHPVAVPTPGDIARHQRFYYLALLERAGLIEASLPDVEIALTGAPEAAKEGKALFARNGIDGRVIGLSPGAAFGGAKRWLPERFAQSAVAIARHREARVAIFGSRDEAALGTHVAALIGRENVQVVNFAGKTSLRDFIDMTAACELFLTNDSGAMHISSALGVPTVVIFGPTDETATGPAGHRHAILREPVDCAPCLLRECPIDHRCMTRVTADRAAHAALNLLEHVS